ERFQIPLASARHAAIVISQTQSDSWKAKSLKEINKRLPARSRPSPPSRFCPAHHNANAREFQRDVDSDIVFPQLSSVSDAWGRPNLVTPLHHLSGRQQPSLLARSEAHYSI